MSLKIIRKRTRYSGADPGFPQFPDTILCQIVSKRKWYWDKFRPFILPKFTSKTPIKLRKNWALELGLGVTEPVAPPASAHDAHVLNYISFKKTFSTLSWTELWIGMTSACFMRCTSTHTSLRIYVIWPTDIEDLDNLKANKMDASKANFIVSRAKFILLNSKLSFYLRFCLT